MIPLKLTLRNFLSYRENVPSLDLAGVHVACLCGDNGHGKSALLDAITWCLWGKARGQVQDDLVSYGADEARVELDFTARDSCFRAVRSRRKAGGRRRQGSSDLQLLALDESGQGTQVISGNSVRETQARIERLVGMEYDTFINSAFLLQGRADEFTNKSPAERKAVLSSILGLEAYDQYQAKARERVGEKRSETDRLLGIIQQTEAEIANLGNPAAELAEVNRQFAALDCRLTAGRKAVEGLSQRLLQVEGIRARLAEQAEQASRVRADMDRIRSAMGEAENRIQEHLSLMERSGEIEANAIRLEDARSLLAALEEARQRHEALRGESNRLNGIIEIERTRLESEYDRLTRKIEKELAPLVEATPSLLAAREEARANIDALENGEAELAKSRLRLQALAQAIGEAQTTSARYQAEGEQLNEKLHLLNGSDTTSTTNAANAANAGAVCPLCLSPLSEDGYQTLSAAYQEEIQEKRNLFRSNRARLNDLEGQKTDLEENILAREGELGRAGDTVRNRLARLDSQIETASLADAELKQCRDQLKALTNLLQSGSFAGEAKVQLADVQSRLNSLGYDEEAFRQTFQVVRELEPFAQLKVRLRQATDQLAADKAALQQGNELLAERSQQLEVLLDQTALMEAAVSELPDMERTLARERSALEQLEADGQALLARRGLLEGEVNRLQSLQSGLGQNQGRLADLQEDQGVYQDLVSAFGRQGIQAMLIETVVPRLEEETNVLLGRMTDNRMHVKLETQRDRRSGAGEPIETLEINVSDELGTRNYEMYSGGEAFRVNLALRIALSRVLSQRTGAPLPTLFIDEGFGTQDASGRERILDVISAIENDFDKIIVITHLDDLKDMFPVRIEVQKDANGSTFWLS